MNIQKTLRKVQCLKLTTVKEFYKYIGMLASVGQYCKFSETLLNQLSNVVVLDFNMLSTIVEHRILSYLNITMIMKMQYVGTMLYLLHTLFDSFQPTYLASGESGNFICSLCSRKGCGRLFLVFQRKYCIIMVDTVTRSRLLIINKTYLN